VFKSILDSVKEVPAGASFIQLNPSYHSNLAQIRMKVESNEIDFEGMSPVVSNLMEIMQNPGAIQKPEVVVAVRGLVQSLIENAETRFEVVEEENEHQSALFEHLEKSFNENVDRSTREGEGLQAISAGLDKRVAGLETATSHAGSLVEKVVALSGSRKDECYKFKMGSKDQTIKIEKVNAIISQLEEILITKSTGIKSFFIQREMKRN